VPLSFSLRTCGLCWQLETVSRCPVPVILPRAFFFRFSIAIEWWWMESFFLFLPPCSRRTTKISSVLFHPLLSTFQTKLLHKQIICFEPLFLPLFGELSPDLLGPMEDGYLLPAYPHFVTSSRPSRLFSRCPPPHFPRFYKGCVPFTSPFGRLRPFAPLLPRLFLCQINAIFSPCYTTLFL